MTIARRDVLKGAVSLPLAAILADPLIARAVAGGTEKVTIKLAGGRSVSAALALPAKAPAGAILLVHEWWGLNDYIKTMAAEFAKEGYVALGIDLYGGKVATDRGAAMTLMSGVDPKWATETLAAWAGWLKTHKKGNGKVATIGWCFGGGWALNASLAAPTDATIVYYGNVRKTAAQVAPLKGPVLGHFATRDGWANKPMVDGFIQSMKKAGKDVTIHWYEADHAFANPSGARYDKADARLAWSRTLAFVKKNI